MVAVFMIVWFEACHRTSLDCVPPWYAKPTAHTHVPMVVVSVLVDSAV